MNLSTKFILLIFSFSIVITSCSDDDSPNPVITGCTDANSINYDVNADTDDGSCLYSIVGVWSANVYSLAGQDLMTVVETFYLNLYADNNFILELTLIDGTFSSGTGTYEYNGTDSLVMNSENWEVSYIDGDNLHMTLTDEDGQFHETEWIKN
tara:strand:- start:807 stop:1265 length:459 start_codon:yes stop_codon:yes gene_type:complete